jgi:hypothetical protein
VNIKYNTIRQVRINAPMSEREKVFDWLWKNNYHIKSFGPKRIGPGLADTTKLLVVGQKRI